MPDPRWQRKAVGVLTAGPLHHPVSSLVLAFPGLSRNHFHAAGIQGCVRAPEDLMGRGLSKARPRLEKQNKTPDEESRQQPGRTKEQNVSFPGEEIPRAQAAQSGLVLGHRLPFLGLLVARLAILGRIRLL